MLGRGTSQTVDFWMYCRHNSLPPKNDDSVQNNKRAGSQWMSRMLRPSPSAPRAAVSLPAVWMPWPEFPTQPSLTEHVGLASAWPSLPQTPCSQWKSLSPILQKCLPGAKPFQHPLLWGRQECKSHWNFLWLNNAPGPVLCTCSSSEGLLPREGGLKVTPTSEGSLEKGFNELSHYKQ